MIIQCENCRAKFRLDDSRVTDRGVKVRCARCKHLFTVTRAQPEPESTGFGSLLEQTPTSQQEGASFSAPPTQRSEAQESSIPFSFSTDSQEEASDSTVNAEPNRFETTISDSAFAQTVDDEFTFSSQEDDKGFVAEKDEEPSTEREVDFDAFDFGDSEANAEEPMIKPSPEPVTEKKEASLEPDFSGDDMFEAVKSSPAEKPAEYFSFDFGTGSFADSQEMDNAEAGEKRSSLTLDRGADSPFSPGEITFDDEPASVAAQRANPDEPKPPQEILPAHTAEVREKSEPYTDVDLNKIFLPDAGQTEQDDLPPLSIASRRKQNPAYTGLITAVALLVVGALGYLGFTFFSDDKVMVAQEVGKINVRAVKASYVKNVSSGLLLVITGEAVNEYPNPRAALQVKGMIFDAKGQILASKSAYGGNLLTDEQLATLPLEKIEAAMANQFGDSLSNLEVSPGKKVPFMIVIASPAIDGRDFGVEPIGSTVASAKQ